MGCEEEKKEREEREEMVAAEIRKLAERKAKAEQHGNDGAENDSDNDKFHDCE